MFIQGFKPLNTQFTGSGIDHLESENVTAKFEAARL